MECLGHDPSLHIPPKTDCASPNPRLSAPSRGPSPHGAAPDPARRCGSRPGEMGGDEMHLCQEDRKKKETSPSGV